MCLQAWALCKVALAIRARHQLQVRVLLSRDVAHGGERAPCTIRVAFSKMAVNARVVEVTLEVASAHLFTAERALHGVVCDHILTNASPDVKGQRTLREFAFAARAAHPGLGRHLEDG